MGGERGASAGGAHLLALGQLVDGLLRVVVVQRDLPVVVQRLRLPRLQPVPRLVRPRAPAGRLLAERVEVDTRGVGGDLHGALLRLDAQLLPTHHLPRVLVHQVVGAQHLQVVRG